MKIAFISGPYRAKTTNGIQENIERARQVAKKYWLKGFSVYCPHLNSAFMDGLVPDQVFLDGCLEMIKRLDPLQDIFVLMKDWQKSTGAKKEFELALEQRLPVIEE